ncbi:DUF2946 family protein [Noviherbaspirillum sp. UKPF54]|uniref:DUF2946 family protein n=1 Tax=Noviherbaspirillum sp. UKPF54 TaxID=2601898 RepID=UPI0011B192B2|nr:DUF2946 family protein [Noviherbaspirillum sp. UKPF54]QDZ28766.1 DUF2946 family protein [Noviherbaspirillum sp. UKPF54]
MDDIVKQAMAKWPNVPHCYGWLALDARGAWRMRDERAQALKLAGDKIGNPPLQAFINRNYTHDEKGRWYFQNGPQRVYVTLEAAPYVARTDPSHGFVLHTGEPLGSIDGAWMTDAGQLLLKEGEKIALVDDRDMAQCLPRLHFGNEEAGDERLIAWLGEPGADETLSLEHAGRRLAVRHIMRDAVAGHFGFVIEPQPDAGGANR